MKQQSPLSLLSPDTVQRIGIFRALQLGDLLVAVPAFRALRAHFPRAEITLIGLPWASAFVERYRCYIDRFVEFAGYPGIKEQPVDPERMRHFLAEQRDYGYDLVLQLHGSGQNSNPFVLELQAKVTAFQYPQAGQERKVVLAPPQWRESTPQTRSGQVEIHEKELPPAGQTLATPYRNDLHEIYRCLAVAELVGCTDLSPRLEFPLFAADHEEATTLLQRLPQQRPWIGLHPGARPPARRWPATYFAELADKLADQFGAQILLTGDASEDATAQAVIAQMQTTAINLAGKTSLGGLAALITRLDLFISNDTGPSHLAQALARPSISIFGPADHRRWEPLDQEKHKMVRRPVSCSPCGYWSCPIDHRCLRWLTPAQVMQAAQQFLAPGAYTSDQRVHRLVTVHRSKE